MDSSVKILSVNTKRAESASKKLILLAKGIQSLPQQIVMQPVKYLAFFSLGM
jgi:hypothetical protein